MAKRCYFTAAKYPKKLLTVCIVHLYLITKNLFKKYLNKNKNL